jgi:hypothetical protein
MHATPAAEGVPHQKTKKPLLIGFARAISLLDTEISSLVTGRCSTWSG